MLALVIETARVLSIRDDDVGHTLPTAQPVADVVLVRHQVASRVISEGYELYLLLTSTWNGRRKRNHRNGAIVLRKNVLYALRQFEHRLLVEPREHEESTDVAVLPPLALVLLHKMIGNDVILDIQPNGDSVCLRGTEPIVRIDFIPVIEPYVADGTEVLSYAIVGWGEFDPVLHLKVGVCRLLIGYPSIHL